MKCKCTENVNPFYSSDITTVYWQWADHLLDSANIEQAHRAAILVLSRDILKIRTLLPAAVCGFLIIQRSRSE